MNAFFAGATTSGTFACRDKTIALPIRYYRDDAFVLFFSADRRAVEATFPSRRLHAIPVSRGRVLLAIAAFNYIDTSIGPYGEVAVAVPVVYGRFPPLPLLPALLESSYPGFGALILHLPVTNRLARDAGRGQWGFTKFVADMRFEISPERLACELGEDGAHILTAEVSRGGRFASERRPLVTYSVRDGQLLRTVIPQRGGYRWKLLPASAHLELGTHPLATQLRQLKLSRRPIMQRYFVERSAILPVGDVVEAGVDRLDGYLGREREGQHRISYGPDQTDVGFMGHA
jgi:hypothetical protein